MVSITSPVFRLPKESHLPLRDQICEVVSKALATSALPLDMPLPSCRDLAQQLGVSRNTVYSAYARLVDLGLIYARDRSGYYGCESAAAPQSAMIERADPAFSGDDLLPIDGIKPAALRRVRHPGDWFTYQYPFVYNQTEPGLFPIDAWRECSRRALNRGTVDEWTSDSIDGDSAHLLRQLRHRLLVYRGLYVNDDEIMITLGSQNALAIVGLLMRSLKGRIAIEDPGYPDARNAFLIAGNALAGVPVDRDGLAVSKIPSGCKLVYVTPSHQFPTSVTMSLQRRHDLVQAAGKGGYLVLEDDYEANLSSTGPALPALRSLDRDGRVIYISSFSKTLSPGLRLGFMVAHRDIIREARAVRGYLVRHAPTLIQETAALFLGLGYHDSHLRKVERRRREGWKSMQKAIERYLSDFEVLKAPGGTSFWLKGPDGFNASILRERLLRKGAIIDQGQTFYLKNDILNTFRLGFAYIDLDRIEAGIRIIGKEARQCLDRR